MDVNSCSIHKLVADVALLAERRVLLVRYRDTTRYAWHLIFHYRSEIGRAQSPVLAGNTADARWFPLDALPDRDDVAHQGWALDVLESILKRAPA